MADNIGIVRAPNNAELQDYTQIGQVSPKQVFLRKLSEVEAEFTRNHEPFDSQCAKLDFADKIETIQKESERRYGYVRAVDMEKLDFGDLKSYGNKKRFDIVAHDQELEMQNVNNTKTAVLVGYTVKYVCKERGHGCSVFIPIELYNERFNKSVGESKKKE